MYRTRSLHIPSVVLFSNYLVVSLSLSLSRLFLSFDHKAWFNSGDRPALIESDSNLWIVFLLSRGFFLPPIDKRHLPHSSEIVARRSLDLHASSLPIYLFRVGSRRWEHRLILVSGITAWMSRSLYVYRQINCIAVYVYRAWLLLKKMLLKQ